MKPQMQPVGYFYYSSQSSVIPVRLLQQRHFIPLIKFIQFTQEFKYNDPEISINWVNLVPPAAEPECGFHGDLCKNNTWRFVIVGLGIAFVIFIIGAFLFKLDEWLKNVCWEAISNFFFTYRHYRYEQKLACLLWKVDMKEVTLISTETSDSTIRTKSLVSYSGIQKY